MIQIRAMDLSDDTWTDRDSADVFRVYMTDGELAGEFGEFEYALLFAKAVAALHQVDYIDYTEPGAIN